MEILIIRHGEQVYPLDKLGRKMTSSPDAPLVELGKRQIRELGNVLDQEGKKINAAYASPLKRAQDTALLIASVMPTLKIITVDNLTEVSSDSSDDHTYEELEEIGGDIYAHPFNEKQESLRDLVERSRIASEFILADARQAGYKSIAIVGHGDPLCALVWGLRHEGFPASYNDMKKEFYPQKGMAYPFTVSDNEPFKIISEGKVLIAKSSAETIEKFRYRKTSP